MFSSTSQHKPGTPASGGRLVYTLSQINLKPLFQSHLHWCAWSDFQHNLSAQTTNTPNLNEGGHNKKQLSSLVMDKQVLPDEFERWPPARRKLLQVTTHHRTQVAENKRLLMASEIRWCTISETMVTIQRKGVAPMKTKQAVLVEWNRCPASIMCPFIF